MLKPIYDLENKKQRHFVDHNSSFKMVMGTVSYSNLPLFVTIVRDLNTAKIGDTFELSLVN